MSSTLRALRALKAPVAGEPDGLFDEGTIYLWIDMIRSHFPGIHLVIENLFGLKQLVTGDRHHL